MDLPDLVLVLIGVVMVAAALVVAAMHRRREHALRDRFAEEYDRVLHDEWRGRR
jgi:hypothetical protein